MTSTNDGKEVKSYQTSGPKSKTYFIELYKSLEARLSEAPTASERTKHLCEAWRRVHSLCQHSAPTTHSHLLSWLQRHTARTVLQTKWQSPERKDDRTSLEEAINVFIVETRTAAAGRDGDGPPWEAQLVARGEWFKKVLEHPWKHPVLNCLLNPDGTPPTDDEVLEWLKEERGVTFVMRLHTLVAEKCDDIAISLATAVMERVRGDTITTSDGEQSEEPKEKPENTSRNFGDKLKEEAGFTVDVWEMLTDIEFVLLHKRDSSRCITLAKQTPLRSSYQLIERLQSRLDTSPREKRLWKNSKEVAVLIAQVVIARCMVVPQCLGGARSALYCCARTLARLVPAARLPAAAAALAAPAATAAHLHTLAAAVDAQLAQKNEPGMKPFVCELYVRAITAGMNELERLKLKTEKEADARSMEQTLAGWFVQLGCVLASSDRVKCECALTAFSVHPSQLMYERIRAAPPLPPIHLDAEQASAEATNPEFGSWASDSRGQTNFVKTSETLNMKARQNQANVLSTAILTEGEAIGLSPELCQDITVLLSGPRVKTLSWDMDRELLLENCRAYLERTHAGTRAVTTELKYLNLNPADFQYLPEEDEDETNIYYGIEKGYEHLVEFQEPEDIWEEAYENIEKAESSYSSDGFDFIQPQRRRKTKKAPTNTEEDDPLSLATETKRKEKKERPHSKERSKEKKKAQGDPLEINIGNQVMEKPKRVRKKKAPEPADDSLSNLVGLKVGKSNKQVTKIHTDSDAESHRSSIRSMNSEDNVLYDGIHYMDDVKSPRSSHSSEGMQNNEFPMINGPIGMTQSKTVFNRPFRPPSVSGIRIPSPSPSQSPSDHSRNNSPTYISEEVKSSITKLLEFRRQRALEAETKKPRTIMRSDGAIAMDKINISPKGVAIPEIPKSYISKQNDNMTTMLKQKVDNILNHRNPNAIPSPVIQYARKTSPDKRSQSYGTRYNNSQADRMKPADRCFSTPPLSDRFLDSVNLISIYDKDEPTHSRYTDDMSSPYSDVSQDRRSSPDMAHLNYKDYLHEFSLSSYNEHMEKRNAGKKVMRPISRVTPVVPNFKSEHKTPQSAKQMQQKKPDCSLNTFSRLSYYKNKQTDMRKSQDMPQETQPQTVGSKLDGFIMNHLRQSHIAAKHQASPSNDPQGHMNKFERPQPSVREHPLLANILQINSSKPQIQQKPATPPKTELSEKDHNDLILLLRQQSSLHKPHTLPAACSKTVTNSTLNSPMTSGSKGITSGTDSNAVIASLNLDTSPQIGKANEVPKKVNEGKIINILSTSIIKSANQKCPKPQSSSIKKPTQGRLKKTEARLKKAAAKPEPRKDPEEWENVMNAILKQKTPCRGPNALDMALNKSSFEKAFEDSLRNPTTLFTEPSPCLEESITPSSEFDNETFTNITNSIAGSSSTSQTTSKTEATTQPILKIPKRQLNKNSKTKNFAKPPTVKPPTVATLLKQYNIEGKTIEKLMQHNQIEITKFNSSVTQIRIPEIPQKHSVIEKPGKAVPQRHVEMPEMSSLQQQSNRKMFKKTVKDSNLEFSEKLLKQTIGEVPKKEIKQAVDLQMKPSNYVGQRQDDPFISGILNSDYDLLDELMDDDLRKEIGELSSDEDSYTAVARNFLKQTNDETNEKNVAAVYNPARNDSASKAPLVVGAVNARPGSKHNEKPQSFSQKPIQQPQINKQTVPAKMTPAKSTQSKLAMYLNANVRNVTTHVVTEPTQAYNNASLLRSNQITVEPNIYIKAVPRPAPAHNVMIIPSDLVYEGYLSVQTPMQTVPNIAPNAYIAVNNTPSINVFQATQYVAPVLSPLIITPANIPPSVAAPVLNNLPCDTTVQPKPVTKVSHLHQPSHRATAQGNNILVDAKNIEAKAANSVPLNEGVPQKLESKTPADENVGKSGERKVLKEVQEKHADEKIDCKRRSDKVDKDLKTQADQERVKKKRLAILNRKISYFCGVKTIALGFSPLQPSAQKEVDAAGTNDSKEGLNSSNQNNLRELCDEMDTNDSKDVLNLSNQNNMQELSDEIKSPATPDSYKENKNEPIQVRRILLRSSNKLRSQICWPAKSTKPSLDNKLGSPSVCLDTPNETHSENDLSDIKTQNIPKRVSKRIRNKSVATPKDAKDNETRVLNKKNTGLPKVRKRNVHKVSNKVKCPKHDIDTDQFFDIEAELLGSTIPKMIPISRDPPEISLHNTSGQEVKDSLITDEREVESLPIQEDQLQQGKILSVNTTKSMEQEKALKAKNEPTAVPAIDINVTSNTEGTDVINDDVSKTNDPIISTSAEAKVEGNETKEPVKQNNEEDIVDKGEAKVTIDEKDKNINVITVKETIPIDIQCITELVQSDKIQTKDYVNTLNQVDIISIELPPKALVNTTPPPPIHPTVANMTKNEIEQPLREIIKDIKKKSARVSIDKNNVCQINKMVVNLNLNESHKVVAPQSQVAASILNDDDDDIQIVGDIPCSKDTIHKETKKLPIYSSTSGIVIENIITNADHTDPLKKTVRIKLGNGKSFKGTISGSVDVNALIEDTTIKSLLMSHLEKPGKLYSIKLNVNKDVSNGNKILSTQNTHGTKPRQPMETVSLLSDDEEENLPQVFETEYGKHKINSINNDIFEKHQKKFKLGSFVPVKKLSLDEENAIKRCSKKKQTLQECVIPDDAETINHENSPSIACQKQKVDTKMFAAIPSKYVQGIFNDIKSILDPVDKEPIEESIVLIDDSSNDSVEIKNKDEPKEKIDALKHMLLKDLGVVDNLFPAKSESTEDVQVTWASEAIDLTDDPVMEPLVDKAHADVKPDYREMINRKCFVKLVRCDDKLNQPKCRPVQVEDDNSEENCDIMPEPVSRSDSFSVLEEISIDDQNEKTEYKLGRSSPVMEIYNLIASLKSEFLTNRNIQDLSLWNCDTEWMTTKKVEYIMHCSKDLATECRNIVVSKSHEVPKLATLVLSYVQREDLISRYNFLTRFPISPISLKRKARPASSPIIKISKLDTRVDETSSSNGCNSSSTFNQSVTDALNVTIEGKNDDHIVISAVGTENELKNEEIIMVNDHDITPDLSDTDVTNMTVSDCYDIDDMELIQKEMQLEDNQDVELHTGGNTLLRKILNNEKVFTVFQGDEDSLLSDAETETQKETSKETFAELSFDIADDIPIDCSDVDFRLKQIEAHHYLQVSTKPYHCHTNLALDHIIYDSNIRETAISQNNGTVEPDNADDHEISDGALNVTGDQIMPKAHKTSLDEVATELHDDENAESSIDCNVTKNIQEEIKDSEALSVAVTEEITGEAFDLKNNNETTHPLPIGNISECERGAGDVLCEPKTVGQVIKENAALSVAVIGEIAEEVNDLKNNNGTVHRLPIGKIAECEGDAGSILCEPKTVIEDTTVLSVAVKGKIAGEVLDVKNDSEKVHSEIPIAKIAKSEDAGNILCETKIVQDISDDSIQVENHPMNQSDYVITSSSYCEKNNLEATTEILISNDPVETNMPVKMIGKHDYENIDLQINDKLSIPEYLNQESNFIERVVMTEEKVCFDSIVTKLENENSTHELKQSVENTITKQEAIPKICATHLPETNDKIVDALNKIFGESNSIDEMVITKNAEDNALSLSNGQNICSNSNIVQKCSFDEGLSAVRTKNSDSVTKLDNYNKNDVADFPQTTDEIVDALKKIFGEPEVDMDSLDVSEVVITENPNGEDLALNATSEHHDDAINVSLREGLSLMEVSDGKTVVEGIVEMHSDEIIDDITFPTLTANTRDVKEIQGDNALENRIVADSGTSKVAPSDENVLSIIDQYIESNGKEEVKGIEYNGPVIGKRYVFSVIKEISDINEQDSRFNEPKDDANDLDHDEKIEHMKLIIPKRTYEKSLLVKRSSRNMKRKKDMSDIKTNEKKYRKGKNIDYPKTTASAISELAYAKEYKRIIDYCSTVKFSYARPFHIDCIDVCDMLKSWPINKCHAAAENDSNNAEHLLYGDTEDTENATRKELKDPLKQTLNEEIVNGEFINDYKPIDINETNFNKGFGERSGRVIPKIGTGNTKMSAATLSDVKQYQPFSMSEVKKAYPSIAHELDTQKVKLSLSTNLIKLKEKIRSFFDKTAVELDYEWLQDKKYTSDDRHLAKFPFGLTSCEFFEVPHIETVVNVVQVGQLPVTTAAQNLVTCDPRVTHVSDASPSQCSDNSPGADTQATVKTEYTELTTANITLPLVQEYAQNRHQSPPSHEQNSPGSDDDLNASTQTLSIVKIELMEEETSQEKLDNGIYENDFSPLPNNNVEYSFEDTSNTLLNTSVNLDNTLSNTDYKSNNMFNTPTSMDHNFTNIFNSADSMDNTYTNMDSTPSSTKSTYTNMNNASTNMYSTSPNMGSSSTEMDSTSNIDDTSPNMDNTNVNSAAMNIDSASTNIDNSYTSIYNPIRRNSNDMIKTSVGNTASNMNDSPTNLENRPIDMNPTHNLEKSNMENTDYDYSYENIEDYATNIGNNNNADNYTDVDNYSSENYPSNVDEFASNVDNYSTNDENYASNVENYATNMENYSTNVENYTDNIDNTNSNTDINLTNIDNPTANMLEEPQDLSMTNSSQETKICNKFDNNGTSKINQIEHAMNAAGISSESVITSGADELANLINQSAQASTSSYSKSSPINIMTLQQALAQVLPPPLNQTSTQAATVNQMPNTPVPQQVLHIVQGNNPQTVINKPNGTHLLHIVQNKSNPAANGLSLVDAGLQQGGNQLIHIVNNGNQNNAQFLKRVNLLTNLTNAQGSNEQKMIQFVCKSADGKSIQLNAGHQRSMVLRLHPTAVPTAPKPTEPQDLSASTSATNSANNPDPSQEIKSRSVYEENYAQFIQNAGPTPGSSTTACQEKATSLPKFNQVFGKQSYQENQNEINDNGLQENSDCRPEENTSRVEQNPEVNNPPLLVRSAPPETTQSQPSPIPRMKQTISPMNIHTTMHGGVIYTRQIPVNIGGGQTINLITVPSTELVDDSPQKQQTDSSFANQEGEQSSIIKLVPHHTTKNPNTSEESNTQPSTSNEANHTPQLQPPPMLTQMRIKLPMLSKGPHIVPGTRLVRPSFFQIQRNVIAGTNQPIYQQLVLTTAPSLGQAIRLPSQQAQSPQAQPILVQTSQHAQSSPHIPVQQVQHAPSSQHLSAQTHSTPPTPQPQSVSELTKPDTEPDSELSTLTLEQLREFDMVLEQVKERSVHPTPSTTPVTKPTPADSTDGAAIATASVSEATKQVLYSVDNSQPTNIVSYVNRKSTVTPATTSFVRSPDSSGIVDTPSSSTQVHITHTVTSKSSTAEGGSAIVSHPKKKKKKKSSSSSSALASLGSPSKTNTLKPQEDEQTTQRILYILAEYKEQVENSPDKNKPAPRRRNQFPPTIGGSKRKRSHCSSRATCRREGVDMSPMHGEQGELGDDSLITLGSEDSSCGTTFSECTDCQESHSPEDTTKVVRSLTFEQETTTQITQSMPPRNVIVGDRQTITVARTTTATTAKPTTTVLMPANYLLPVSMLKGGQQIAIMTNRGPKILVGAGDNNAGALLFQRLIGPGLKPVLTRPGVRHIRLPTTALHNLQAFNIQTTPVTQAQPPDSTAPQAPTPTPPDLVDTRAMSSPWQDREAQDKPDRGPSPDCTEPWNLPSSSIADDYGYEEIVRTDNMERTVLVVQQRKDGRHHRVTHVSTAALRHKYAILEHELRLQKSLSEECEDLGVDSPSASDLFPEADILFGAPSPAHEQTIDQCNTPPPIPMPQTIPQPDLDDQIATDQLLTPSASRNDELDLNLDHVGEIVTVGEDGVATIPTINAEEFARSHPNTTFHTEPEDGELTPFTIAQGLKGRHITFHANRVPGTVVMAPQTTVISQATVNSNEAHNTVKFIDIDKMINSLPCPQPVSVQSVLVKEPGVSTRPATKADNIKDSGTSAPRTSSKFGSLKELGTPRSSSKFDSLKEPGTSKSVSKFDSLKDPGASHRPGSKFDSLKESGTASRSHSKYDILKDSGNSAPKPLSKFDSLLTDSKHPSNATRPVVHSTAHGTQVIRRLRYDEKTNTRTNTRFHFEEPRGRSSISDEVKKRNDRAIVESMGDNASSPGQPELFWDSTTTERHERRFHFSESDKVTKSPFDELLNDSSAYGPHTRLDSVIKAARPERAFERTSFEGISVSGSSDESRPLRTYPPKRVHTQDTERHFTLKTTTTTTHHHEVDRKKTLPRCQEGEGRRRTGRGLVKRGCSCCNGSSAPPKKRSRPKKPTPDFATSKSDNLT